MNEERVLLVDLGNGAVLRIARQGYIATLDVLTLEERDAAFYKPASLVHLFFQGSERLVVLRDSIAELVAGMQKWEADHTI